MLHPSGTSLLRSVLRRWCETQQTRALLVRCCPPMPGGIVLHDASIERARNELAMANTREQMARSGALYNLPPPDPNSEFMRKMKAATIERQIQASEAQQRHDNGESARAYDRKTDYYAVLGIDRQASAAEVRRAFRRLSLRYHPVRTCLLEPWHVSKKKASL